jgi:hypothetical protein
MKIIEPPRSPLKALVALEHQESPLADLIGAFNRSVHPCTALFGLDIPKRPALLDDWFKVGDCGFIFAPRGLGKTWLALGMATALASGRPLGPWKPSAARRVLYVDGEMALDAVDERIRGLGGAENLSVLNHEVLFHETERVLNLADNEMQDALTAKMLADKVEVVFLDNLSCLFSGVKENDGDDWEKVLPWLLTLRRHRIAVVLVHHAGRNGLMRGTSRREDAAFWMLRLDELGGDKKEGARFITRFDKQRNSPRALDAVEWHFTTQPEGMVQVVHRPADSMEVFRQWIVDGLTSAEDIAREMGVSKGTVSKWAKRAMDDGWLTKAGREYRLV